MLSGLRVFDLFNLEIIYDRYTNGVLVEPINTDAMKMAMRTGQTPFALLRPLNGIPVLVRVLPAGDKQVGPFIIH